MNKERFDTYLKHPETMNDESLSDLRQVINDYPYFTAGRIMLLRNLNMTNDSDYDKELPLTAIYAGNRSILYNYIFNQKTAEKNDPDLVKSAASEVQTSNEKAPHKETPAENQEAVHQTEVIQKAVPEVSEIPVNLITPDPIPMNPIHETDAESAVHSFSNWLEIMSSRKQEVQERAPKKQKSWDLIDDFIQGSPKIPQTKEVQSGKESTGNLADQSAMHHEEFMTETLAKIYIKQKHYNKAIQIFKKLSLKYPEKSIYFAGQIKIVEQLLTNEK